jgi:Flp pilus assembly pilin Flp
MATLAKLVVKLVTDVSEFEAGMQAASKKLTKIGDDMAKVGDSMTKFVTLPIVAAGAAAVKFASDLQDSTDTINQAFGQSADVVKKFAQDAAVNLGLSQAAAEQAAGGFGLFLTNMGIVQNKAADMSTKLVSLAVDLAELRHVDPSEMLASLQSALAGRGGDLKRFGIIVDEATIKQKAMAMGIYSGVGAMNDATRATAAYQLILDQTAKYQGYFANQTDDVGVSLAKLKAVAENLLASFGTAALPALSSFLNSLIPILQWFNALPPSVKQGIIYVALFAAALGPILSVGGRVISTFGTLAKLFQAGGLLAGVGKLIPALGGVIPWLSSFVGLVGEAGLGGALSAAFPGLAALAAGFASIALPVIVLIAAIGLLIFTIIELGPAAWNSIQMLGGIFRALPQMIGPALASVGQAIGAWLKTAWESIVNWVKNVGQTFGSLPGLIGQKLAGVGQVISNMLRNAWQTVANWATSFYQAGQALIVGLLNGILSYAVYLVQTVMHVIQSVIDAVKRMLNISSPSKVFSGIGKNMMLGLEVGVNEFSNKPISATAQTTGAVIQAAGAIRSGSGGSARSVNVGPITINGDLSAGQKASLAAWFEDMVENKLVEALGEPA